MNTANHPTAAYPVRHLPMSRPFVWLGFAWRDLTHHRSASLAYGLMISAFGIALFAYQRHPFFVAAFISFFLLLGPLLAAGLCQLSRASDLNEPSSFDASLKALSHNYRHLMDVAYVLCSISVIWFMFSYAMMSSTLGSVAPSVQTTVFGNVLGHLSSGQIMAYALTTGTLAIVVFALSVVTVPMIIDHHVEAKTAMKTSLKAAAADFPAMLVWASIISLFVAVGFATFLLGMIVIFPLLGHATWYAYKDLVKD